MPQKVCEVRMIIKVDLTETEFLSLKLFLVSDANSYRYYFADPGGACGGGTTDGKISRILRTQSPKKIVSNKLVTIKCVTLEIQDKYEMDEDSSVVIIKGNKKQKTRIDYLKNLFRSMGDKFPKDVVTV